MNSLKYESLQLNTLFFNQELKYTQNPNSMKRIILSVIIAVCLIFQILGQASRPFPQNINYSYGYKPTTLTANIASTNYDSWNNTLVVSCDSGYRVIVTENNEETKVEAIGFGTLLAAYRGDKTKFDGLYNFYKRKRTAIANNMMAWSVTCDDLLDPGSATDGDIDVAFALIVAHEQWGENYLEEARNVIQTIKSSVMITCSDLTALAPGYKSTIGGIWGGCNLTDIQYYTPAFFRVFAEVMNDDSWNKLADDTYTILNNSAYATTGLVPDWQSVSGIPGGIPATNTAYYRYDACRVPWRIALDYLWNGNIQAGTWCTIVSNWAFGIGAANIRDGYNLDGTEHNDGYHNSSFVGGFAVAAMCNDQTVANSFATEMNNLPETYWFNLCTRTLYLFTMSGNFWKPDVTTGIEKYASHKISIFPNPLQEGMVTIELDHQLVHSGSAMIRIMNALGQVVFRDKAKFVSNSLTIRPELSKGLYIVVFNDEDITFTDKLIIE